MMDHQAQAIRLEKNTTKLLERIKGQKRKIAKQKEQIDIYRSALNVCLYGWAACGESYTFNGLGQSEYLQTVLMPLDYPETAALIAESV